MTKRVDAPTMAAALRSYRWRAAAGALLAGVVTVALLQIRNLPGLGSGDALLARVELALLVGPTMMLVYIWIVHRQRQAQLRQERQEEAIQQKEWEQFMVLGRLAASIAHEVRNPLHNMQLLIDEVEHLEDVEAEFPAVAERLKANIDRINHAVELVYRLARPGEVRTRLESADHVDLLQVLSLARDRLPVADQPRVAVIVVGDPQKFWIAGEAEATQTIFDNLLRNAAQASSGAPVYVDIQRDDNGQRFTATIYNEGSLAQSFKIPKLQHVTQRQQGARGLGLGVVIVNELAKQMRMQVSYASDEAVVSFRVEGWVYQGLFDTEQVKEEVDANPARIDR